MPAHPIRPPAPLVSRRGVLGGALAAAGGLALTGCADTPVDTSAGGTLRVGVPADVNLATVLRFQALGQIVRRTVLEYVVDQRPDGTHVPYLAKDWEFSKDKRRLVLNLRDDVAFHSGRPLDAEDVVFSVTAAQDKVSGAQAGKLFARSAGIRASGRHQVTVRFDEPFLAYLDGLAMLPIVDRRTYADREKTRKVIGTGPFVWDTWKPGTSLTLRRNRDYWRPRRPVVDRVVYDVIADAQAMLAAVRSESVDLAMRVIARDAASLAKDNRFAVGTTQSYEVYLGANCTVKPLDDVRVRRAIAYALDRDRICRQVYRGIATPSCVPWVAGTPGVTDAHRDHYRRDLARARALLADAGAAGAEITVSSLASEPTTGAVLDIVAYNLREIGLAPKVVPLDAAQFETTLAAGRFTGMWITDVALVAMGQATALLTANPLVVDGNSENFTEPGYGAAVRRVVADTAAGRDPAAASAALTDYLLDQAFHLSIAQVRTSVVTRSRLSGVRPDLTLALDLTDVRGAGS